MGINRQNLKKIDHPCRRVVQESNNLEEDQRGTMHLLVKLIREMNDITEKIERTDLQEAASEEDLVAVHSTVVEEA